VGGTEKQILLLLKHIDRNLIQPRVLITQSHELTNLVSGNVEEMMKDIGVPTLISPAKRYYDFETLQFLRKQLLLSADVYWLLGYPVSWISRLIISGKNAGVLGSIRNTNNHRSRLLHFTEGIFSRFCNYYISNSVAAKNFVAKASNISENKIGFIPNALNTNHLTDIVSKDAKRKICEELAIPETSRLLVNVSNIDPRKGHKDIIQAFHSIAHKYKDTHILFVGEDKTNGDVKQQVKRFNLQNQVHFTGFKNDAYNYISAGDLMISASYSEGMSNSIMEALTLGVPVLATDVGDNQRMIESAKAGIIIPAGDVEKLTIELIGFLNEPKYLVAAGNNAKEWAKKEFSVEVYVNRYTKLFECLSKKQCRSDYKKLQKATTIIS